MLTQSLFDQGPPAPCPSPFNMAEYVLAAGVTRPDHPALEVLGKTSSILSHAELRARVLATAGGLRGLGLPDGARLLLRVGNEARFPILYLGAIAAGYVPVPTSTQLTVPEVQYLIDDLEPALTLFGDGVARLDTPSLSPDEVAGLETSAPIAPLMGDPNRLAYIIYTSGTSGKPRAVAHAHRAIWARRMMWDGWYGLNSEDRLLHAGAFNWTYTLGTGLMDPWAIGATALIPEPGTDPTDLGDLLAQHKATIFAASPGIYRQLLKGATRLYLPSLRHGLSAGEKLPHAVATQWTATTGTHVYEALGMSEISTFISTAPGHSPPFGVTGRPQNGRRIAVLEPKTKAIQPLDTPGILAVHRDDPGLMLGYRNASEDMASKLHENWFLTGDTVKMDAGAHVTYLGRDDDMMNAGGYRVSPIEVETVLNAHPDIREAAAVAVEVRPGVFVIAAAYCAAYDLEEAVLRDWCSARLARYKTPRLFRRTEALPKGANNKLQRARLRADWTL